MWFYFKWFDNFNKNKNTDNFKITIWGLDYVELKSQLIGHTNTITKIIKIDDTRICSCSNDSTIKIWNIQSGLCEKPSTCCRNISIVFSLSFSNSMFYVFAAQ